MEKHKSVCKICESQHCISSSDIADHHCLVCHNKAAHQRCICKFCMTGILSETPFHKPIFKYKSWPQMTKTTCIYRNYFNIFTNKIEAFM